MAKMVKLADVLWRASKHLHPDSDAGSCCLAYRAEHGRSWSMDHDRWYQAANASEAVAFLRSLGCPVKSISAFDRFPYGMQRQGVRYMWLLLAMHVAEDEGIEIEVKA